MGRAIDSIDLHRPRVFCLHCRAWAEPYSSSLCLSEPIRAIHPEPTTTLPTLYISHRPINPQKPQHPKAYRPRALKIPNCIFSKYMKHIPNQSHYTDEKRGSGVNENKHREITILVLNVVFLVVSNHSQGFVWHDESRILNCCLVMCDVHWHPLFTGLGRWRSGGCGMDW